MSTFATRIRPHVQAELDASSLAEARGHFQTAFRHLERAHVLGQRSTREHVRVHWHLFRFAVRHDRSADALGQLWRLIGAALLTAAGLVPMGNTGGSNVSGLRRMPVPGDLQQALDEADSRPTTQPARAARTDGAVATVGARTAAAVATAAAGATRATLASTAAAAAAALILAGCGTAPSDLDLSLEHPSTAGVYRVSLVPPERAPAINQLHSWTVRLAGADGAPVHGATFAVDGGMPQHGHGLPTQPRVTREIGDGTYRLDGMKFSMTGWWEVKLAIQSPLGSDRVTFNTVVGQPPVQR